MQARTYRGGYIGLIVLVLGCALALGLYMYMSPLRPTEPGTESAGQNAINRANAVQGMADHHNGEIEKVMGQ